MQHQFSLFISMQLLIGLFSLYSGKSIIKLSGVQLGSYLASYNISGYPNILVYVLIESCGRCCIPDTHAIFFKIGCHKWL